jgi:hypothetical protein
MLPHPHTAFHSLPVRVGCALLALWIFLLSLAGVSPSLHAWLHADTGSGCAGHCHHPSGASSDADGAGTAPADQGGHFCGVIALQGAITANIHIALPERCGYQQTHLNTCGEQLIAEKTARCQQTRAPPIKIYV